MAITLSQAIRNAIAAENAAEQFYRRLAEGTKQETDRQLLLRIADQEAAHAAGLKSVSAQLTSDALPDRADALATVIETSPAGMHASGLSTREALEIALEAENSAILYYDALASSSSGEASAFFARVGQEEAAHAAFIQEMLRQCG